MEYYFKGVLKIQSILKSGESPAASPLGAVSYYNGLIFNDMTALQADCEGALAVGGNARFGSSFHNYDIGGAGVPGWETIIIGNHNNPDNYPSLLLDGIVDSRSSTARIYTGNTVMTLSNQQHYQDNLFRFDCADGVSFLPDELCEDFFTQAKEQIYRTSDALTAGNTATITLSDLQALGRLNLSDYENININTSYKILCFNLDCKPDDIVKISEIDLTDAILDYDTVVINLFAENITFSDGAMLYDNSPIAIVPSTYPGNQLIRDLSSKLIFNFPNATEINMLNYSVIGSIIAPKADIIGSGGSVNGMLIANTLLQSAGMELHAFTISLGENLWTLGIDHLSCTVEVILKDSATHTVLSDALFSLYKFNAQTRLYDLLEANLATSAEGILLMEELPLGSYKLIETKAPVGYALPEPAEITFEIKLNDEGEIIQVDTIYVDNEKLTECVTFCKIDSENHEIKLEGAVFSLFIYNEHTDEYDLIASNLTTSEHGLLKTDDLLPGIYKLVETKAPDGYYLGNDRETHFTVELDQEGEIIEHETIEITNIKLGCVEIIKIDLDNTHIKLPGAKFTLYKYNAELERYEELRANLITGANGILMLEDLYPGEYMLTETKAPYGYKLPSNPHTLFTVEL